MKFKAEAVRVAVVWDDVVRAGRRGGGRTGIHIAEGGASDDEEAFAVIGDGGVDGVRGGEGGD